MANGVAVDLDVVVYSCPPSTSAYTYNNMWAYGNHFKVELKQGPHMPRMIVVLHAYLGKVAIVLYETRTL
jgi:hypothetical protein